MRDEDVSSKVAFSKKRERKRERSNSAFYYKDELKTDKRS